MPKNHSQYDIKIGNVSPEQWTFHKFSFTGLHEPHLKFKFRVFSGNVFAVFAREEKPPGFATPASNHYTKVIEPAEQVQHKGEEILFCNASDRVKYIGVFVSLCVHAASHRGRPQRTDTRSRAGIWRPSTRSRPTRTGKHTCGCAGSRQD